ncbi:alpha/beta fold hydrolase [Streptomyces sp. NPDC001530]|uniref:alpha/beta fold hydrolase n=1 Tax=Streptomyces sp. NPDC001530 TaxID=3364582 RepID=UPI0036A4A59F
MARTPGRGGSRGRTHPPDHHYVDFAHQRAFTGRPFLAHDAPGCGETFCEDVSTISIPFLVETAQAVLDHAGIRRFHLIGHSMGGLTGLLLAHQEPDRVLSFVDIEGNVAPEDCFLSRQILTHPSDDDAGFFDDFVERARRSSTTSSALYAASLRHKVRPGAVRGIFESMVDLSDHGDLMPKLAEIPRSGHWPMYANPVAMWERIAGFVRRSEAR